MSLQVLIKGPALEYRRGAEGLLGVCLFISPTTGAESPGCSCTLNAAY